VVALLTDGHRGPSLQHLPALPEKTVCARLHRKRRGRVRDVASGMHRPLLLKPFRDAQGARATLNLRGAAREDDQDYEHEHE